MQEMIFMVHQFMTDHIMQEVIIMEFQRIIIMEPVVIKQVIIVIIMDANQYAMHAENSDIRVINVRINLIVNY